MKTLHEAAEAFFIRILANSFRCGQIIIYFYTAFGYKILRLHSGAVVRVWVGVQSKNN